MNIQQLTLDFACFVREALGDNLAEVQKRNLHREEGTCHSHDFCDANQCMVDALAEQNETYHIVDDPNDERSYREGADADQPYIDDAWNVARENGFDDERIRKSADWLYIEASPLDWSRSAQARLRMRDSKLALAEASRQIAAIVDPALKAAMEQERAHHG
jgi:hypothetical protein